MRDDDLCWSRSASSTLTLTQHFGSIRNSQQDTAEMLHFVIDELKSTSVEASDLILNTIRINASFNQCFCFSAKEEKLDILTIPLSPNINSSFSKF